MCVLRVDANEAWLCSKLHRYSVVLRRMRVDPHCKDDLVFENPPAFISSIAMFGSMFAGVIARSGSSKSALPKVSVFGFDGVRSCIGVPTLLALPDPRKAVKPVKARPAKRLKAITDKEEVQVPLALDDKQIDAMVAEVSGNIDGDAVDGPIVDDVDELPGDEVESGDEIVDDGVLPKNVQRPEPEASEDAIAVASSEQVLRRWRESFDVSCDVLLECQQAVGAQWVIIK